MVGLRINEAQKERLFVVEVTLNFIFHLDKKLDENSSGSLSTESPSQLNSRQFLSWYLPWRINV